MIALIIICRIYLEQSKILFLNLILYSSLTIVSRGAFRLKDWQFAPRLVSSTSFFVGLWFLQTLEFDELWPIYLQLLHSTVEVEDEDVLDDVCLLASLFSAFTAKLCFLFFAVTTPRKVEKTAQKVYTHQVSSAYLHLPRLPCGTDICDSFYWRVLILHNQRKSYLYNITVTTIANLSKINVLYLPLNLSSSASSSLASKFFKTSLFLLLAITLMVSITLLSIFW